MTRALALTALLLGAPSLPAAAEAGRTAAAFLRRALSARAAGMAGAHVAVVDPGPDAPQFNPAGLAFVSTPALATSYLHGFGGVTHGHLAFAQPLRRGALGAGLLYFNAGPLELNLSDGRRGTVTSEEDMAWTLSYGFPLAFGLNAGVTYRFLRMELAETAHAVSHQGDAGAVWRTPLRGLSLGAAYQYHGGDIVFEEAGDPPPKTWRLGAALRLGAIDSRKVDRQSELEAFDLTLATDLVNTLFQKPSPRVGLELGMTPALMNRVALRFGWVLDSFAEGLTFGAGFQSGRLRLDYGFGLAREMRSLQNATLIFSF